MVPCLYAIYSIYSLTAGQHVLPSCCVLASRHTPARFFRISRAARQSARDRTYTATALPAPTRAVEAVKLARFQVSLTTCIKEGILM